MLMSKIEDSCGYEKKHDDNYCNRIEGR